MEPKYGGGCKDGGTPSGGGARWWYDPVVRAIIFQVILLSPWSCSDCVHCQQYDRKPKKSIRAGFGFLSEPAGFEIPITAGRLFRR